MPNPAGKSAGLSPLSCLALGLVVALAAAYTITEWTRPSVLLVGNLTVDLVDGKRALGGAISYAAAVLSAFGIRACIVTAGGPDADLSVFEGHELHVVPTAATLTFEHTYTWWGNKRKLRVTAQPNVTLTPEHVPRHCMRARTLLLGPLTPEDLDSPALTNMPQGWWDRLLGFRQHVGLMAQGLQRGLDAGGHVIPFTQPSAQLTDSLGPRTVVFLSDVETDVWTAGTVEDLAGASSRWLVTRGEDGADELTPHGFTHLPAVEVDAVDTNGAGDTFATAYMVALGARRRSPGKFANWAASRAVTLPQACKPHCVQQRLRRSTHFLSAVSGWASSQMDKLASSSVGRQVLAGLQPYVITAQQYSNSAGSICTSVLSRLIRRQSITQ